jgi:hypothetical protein
MAGTARVTELLEQALALYKEEPLYWAGVILWLLGFAAYVPACCGRGRLVLSQTGLVLCWLGFAVTLLAYFVLDGRYRVPSFEPPTLAPAYWLRSDTQIWLLWIAGSLLLIASWLRWSTAQAGWLGLAAAMVGVVASWPADEATRRAIIMAGTATLAALLLVMAWRGELRQQAIAPGDYVAELTALCGGSRWKASRLIREEQKRRPGLSQAGAALSAVTRLRHEREPRPPL